MLLRFEMQTKAISICEYSFINRSNTNGVREKLFKSDEFIEFEECSKDIRLKCNES